MSPARLSLRDFDFALPPALIAQHPAPSRSSARLLDGRADVPQERVFHELPQLLRPGDLLICNDTRVIKARLFGTKPGGGKVELLVERVLGDGEVLAHLRASKKPPSGGLLHLCGGAPSGGFDARVLGRWPDVDGALFRLHFFAQNATPAAAADVLALLERFGRVPLPPYIERAADDADAARYQSIFAAHPGAVAAPTASLHMDAQTLARLHARGIEHASVTLHVGAGTFAPVRSDNLAEHRMHGERYHVPPATLEAMQRCRERGGRVVALGTTAVRALESRALGGQDCGETHIFITPGFAFRCTDLLITNFHLPKSTLLMLVSAFAGHEKIMDMYRHAVQQQYRFFSYGDAMLLQREGLER